MMRKFPKLLAVVLAVAIVICPAVCLTSMAADPTGTYGMAAEIVSGETYDTATLNIVAGADSEGFVAAVAKIAVEGYDLYEGTESDPVDAVTATGLKADGDSLDLGVQYNYNSADKVLTVVIMDKDNTTLNFIASAAVSIKVCNPVSGNHTLTLTHIQASDAGTYNAETGKFEGNESLFTFPNADNNASGLIDQALATGTVAGVSCDHAGATYVDDPLPTCTADGTRTYTCNVCGHTWTEVLPAGGHSTTGEYGSNADNHWEICENCDDHVNEAAHVFGNDNTCDVCGYTRVCTHSWDEGTVTTEATCTKDGVKTYTCAICGETKTETITAPGHTKGEAKEENRVEATCETVGGYDTVVRCTVCNEVLSSVHTEIPALGHKYVYTSNSDGTHNAVCSNDANHTITNEACSYVDGVCEFCGYKQPAEGPGTVTAKASLAGYASKFQFGYNFTNISYSGDTSDVIETGILVLRGDLYSDGMVVNKDTSGIMLAVSMSGLKTTLSSYVLNFPLARFTTDYYFFPYVVLTDGTLITGDPAFSSYEDYCVSKLTDPTSATGIRAQAYIDAYYTVYTASGAAIPDYANRTDYLDQSKTYSANYSTNTDYQFPEATSLTATAAVAGYASKFQFGYNFTNISYSGDASDVAETGVLVLRGDLYTPGSAITKDTEGVMLAVKGSGLKTTLSSYVLNFPLSRITTDYIFVPYVILNDGTFITGEYRASCYADYLVGKLTATNAGDTQRRAHSILDAYAFLINATSPTFLYK